MGNGKGRWHDGRRAWSRLNSWQRDEPADAPGGTGRGADALEALADVGYLRHLLDQVELTAVKSARRHGRSWAEVATRLGVSRQSAWERWRELDEPEQPQRAAYVDTAVAELVEQVSDDPATSDAVKRARERRRQSSVVVPNVVGLSWTVASERLDDKGLTAVAPDADGPPLSVLGLPDGFVTDQTPEAGAKVPAGTRVTVWVERGGGSGVREPRRPSPPPRSGREMISEDVAG